LLICLYHSDAALGFRSGVPPTHVSSKLTLGATAYEGTRAPFLDVQPKQLWVELIAATRTSSAAFNVVCAPGNAFEAAKPELAAVRH
jgi:hypothetical protein